MSFDIQQFVFKPITNNNIKPVAGLRPATLVVGEFDQQLL